MPFKIESQIFSLDETPAVPFWDPQYYKKYFNISTDTAINRTLKALWPLQNEAFLESDPDPDLYVPLWNFITLVLTMAVLSSVFSGTQSISSITNCFTAFGLYLGLNSAIAFFVLRFKGAGLTLPVLLALYGYSLVVYVPMSILYLLPYKLFRLVILLGSAGISLHFLERNLGATCDKHLERNAIFGRIYAVSAKLLLIYAICYKIY